MKRIFGCLLERCEEMKGYEIIIKKIRDGTVTESELNSLENGLNECFKTIESLRNENKTMLEVLIANNLTEDTIGNDGWDY